MEWLKRLFGMVGGWLKRASKTAIGVAADQIMPFVLDLVKGLEDNSTMSGTEKAEWVKNEVKKNYGDISSVVINLAINTALALIREGME